MASKSKILYFAFHALWFNYHHANQQMLTVRQNHNNNLTRQLLLFLASVAYNQGFHSYPEQSFNLFIFSNM